MISNYFRKLNLKTFLLFFLLVGFTNNSFSQKAIKNTIEEKVSFKRMNEVEIQPEFIGGIERFYKFIGNNYHRCDTEPSGTMEAHFIIDTDGCLVNIEIVKNEVGIISAKEFVRVLQNCPRWNPGFDNGKPVRVMSRVPITLQSGYKVTK